jgi:hypothetical protein
MLLVFRFRVFMLSSPPYPTYVLIRAAGQTFCIGTKSSPTSVQSHLVKTLLFTPHPLPRWQEALQALPTAALTEMLSEKLYGKLIKAVR